MKTLIATTSPLTLYFLARRQIQFLSRAGIDVQACSRGGALLDKFHEATRVPVHRVGFYREIHLLRDLGAVVSFGELLRRLSPAILQTHTPKAGLIGMTAGWLTRVRIRIYTINGLVLEAKTGWLAKVLAITERIACWCATDVIAVSPSLRKKVIEKGLCCSDKIKVLGHGSSHGVDLQHFDPRGVPGQQRNEIRAQYWIPSDAVVIGFVGRLVRDKGIHELAEAWRAVRAEFPEAWLLLCGAFESHNAVDPRVVGELAADERVVMTRVFVEDMPSIYAAADLVALPTYREGLPNVALEAGAMELPVVATTVTGCVDAILDGKTGILVPPRDAEALAGAMAKLIREPELRRRLGVAAREFVASRFSEQRVNRNLLWEYGRLLEREGMSLPEKAKQLLAQGKEEDALEKVS